MQFNVSDEDRKKIIEWKKEQDEINGSNYYGAIGGVLTYSFTPTGLGVIFTVKHDATGNELDLTDVDEW